MENPQNQSQEFQPKTPFWQSTTARLLMVGALTLILLIPLLLVDNLIWERSQRKQQVVKEISDKWGTDVYLYGPIVRIPYTVYEESVSVNQKTKETVTSRTASTEYAYFFPEELQNDSKVETDKRNYGNYESVVYTSRMDFKGKFSAPDFSSRDIADADIQWDKASVVIKTTNLKSIRDEVRLKLGDSNLTFEPVFNNAENDSVDALETGYFDARQLKSASTFQFKMTYRGSCQLLLVPIGKTTTVSMQSNWPDPSFTGNFLPADDKKITQKGFTANWKVLHVNRPFGQQTFGSLPDLARFAFGVKFVIPVDEYQQNQRASKYGSLMIGLTFLIFFLIQVQSKIKIHIFQYTMIGLALIMFYTLLISITEHSSFMFAYLVASAAVIAMISLYSISILKNRKFPALIGISLTVLYSFIYVIIQLEDYALLFGSIGLFAILGGVMWVSRKMEWS
ncbi:cell envelope integrity protein CreD [Flavobacterium silvaticum]|uniref:Cell envelope integrity protein CreD n=1 Tax=Flavobacterium silvaticum TaxID=1852020 RepID=A0A972FWN8_9FLAO|nr:cell envelope integrity protein CreD [Flavobacterium silvaticum]NMH29392.1 cell envelope integrity protein CreD [Flavobacterium silvaticum]